jgi:peptidoglycan/xylan/chitin deacetylase (PgdA/CDA1 family)
MSKKLLFALLFVTRVDRLVAWLNRNRVTILCYHSVTWQSANRSDPHKLHLNAEAFLRHLDYLQAHYHIIQLSEFVRARRENIKLNPWTAVLTFEDGIRNFSTVVAPIVLKRKVPVTSFIVTSADFTKETSTLNGHWTPEDDDSFLSWSEVTELAAKGLEFGAHTHSHLSLPELSLNEARNELTESLSTLKTRLGVESVPLSYPHGRTSDQINRLSESLGYSCGVTTRLGGNDANCELFSLRRIVVASDDDLPTFAARLSGLTAWYAWIVERFKGRLTASPDTAPGCFDALEEFKS